MKRMKLPNPLKRTSIALWAFGARGMRALGLGMLGLLVAGVTPLILGCGQGPPPSADKTRALSALRTALQSWKVGESPDAVKNTLFIQMIDPAWERGAKLEKFEIEESLAQPSGFDLGVPVKMWIENSGGSAKTIKYTVSTSPALVITRDFGGQ